MFLSTEAPVSGRRVCPAEPAGEDSARPRGSALVASPVTTETWGAVRAGGCRGRGEAGRSGAPSLPPASWKQPCQADPGKQASFQGISIK